MASDATNMSVRGNMHIDTRIIEVADFKSEVKFEFSGYCGLRGHQNGSYRQYGL